MNFYSFLENLHFNKNHIITVRILKQTFALDHKPCIHIDHPTNYIHILYSVSCQIANAIVSIHFYPKAKGLKNFFGSKAFLEFFASSCSPSIITMHFVGKKNVTFFENLCCCICALNVYIYEQCNIYENISKFFNVSDVLSSLLRCHYIGIQYNYILLIVVGF